MGHFFGDQMVYMDTDERAARAASDPVDALRARVVAEGYTEGDVLAVEADIASEVEAALAAARSAADPDPSEVFDDVVAALV
jgi:pyruvate dehydrogenase E1 component alpha subunit